MNTEEQSEEQLRISAQYQQVPVLHQIHSDNGRLYGLDAGGRVWFFCSETLRHTAGWILMPTNVAKRRLPQPPF
jgi:hypothetical protein